MTAVRPFRRKSGTGWDRGPAAARALFGERANGSTTMLLVAESKAAASRLVAGGIGFQGLTARHLEPAIGLHSDALREAGLFDEPGLLIISERWGDSPVVRMDGDDAVVIGRLVSKGRDIGSGYTFVPTGTQ